MKGLGVRSRGRQRGISAPHPKTVPHSVRCQKDLHPFPHMSNCSDPGDGNALNMHSHLLFYANKTQANTDWAASLAVFMMSLIVVHDAKLSNTVQAGGRRVWAVYVWESLGFHT